MGKDKVEPDKRGSGQEPKLTTMQEVAKSYFQNAMNTLGREGVDNEIVRKIRDVVAIHLGPDMEKFVISNALTLMAAFVEIRTLLIKRGVPAWVAEMLDEGLNDLFEGARSSIVDKDRMPADAAQRVLKNASEKWTKQYVDEITYDKAIQLLSKEDFDLIENFFLSLPATHQSRFNALKPRLKNLGEIRLFMKRLERAKRLGPTYTDSAKLLQTIEPFYGIKPYNAEASFGGVFDGFKKMLTSGLVSAQKSISRLAADPDRAFAIATEKVRAANHRNDASRAETGRKFQDLKKTRICDIRKNKKDKSK